MNPIALIFGVFAWACFFGMIFASGFRKQCLLGWIVFMALASWMDGGMVRPVNPPAANQAHIRTN